MSKKYDIKLLWDYINGEEIIDYNVDELENDCEFLLDVFRITKDKNMYNLCSNEIKKNSLFVKELMNIFSNDIDFIKLVVDTYLDNNISINALRLDDKEIEKAEIIIMFTNMINKTKSKIESYQVCSTLFVETLELELELAINKNKEIENYNIGLGFVIHKDYVNNNKVLTNFIAKRLIEKIFYCNDKMNFEDLIHKYYKSGKITKEKGIRNFIISYISLYDQELSNYIITNLDVIKEIEKDIKKIENNWDNYIEIVNTYKIELLYNEVDDLINYEYIGTLLTGIEIVYYVVKLLHLEDIFYKYDYLSGDMIEENISIDIDKLSSREIELLKIVKKYAKELFSNPYIDKKFDNYFEKNIIEFNPIKKHKRASN